MFCAGVFYLLILLDFDGTFVWKPRIERCLWNSPFWGLLNFECNYCQSLFPTKSHVTLHQSLEHSNQPTAVNELDLMEFIAKSGNHSFTIDHLCSTENCSSLCEDTGSAFFFSNCDINTILESMPLNQTDNVNGMDVDKETNG